MEMTTQPTTQTTTTTTTAKPLSRLEKRRAARARRIERNRAMWAEGMKARADRITAQPSDAAYRFAELQ